MYKNYEYYNAGTNVFHRWGKKTIAMLEQCLIPNKNGYYTIEANGGKHWTIGTSIGQYGEYAKYKNTYFSVNSNGYIWAKVGTDKEAKFIELVNDMIRGMKRHKEDVEEEHELKRLSEVQ